MDKKMVVLLLILALAAVMLYMTSRRSRDAFEPYTVPDSFSEYETVADGFNVLDDGFNEQDGFEAEEGLEDEN